MSASHGNTPAAWTAVSIMFVGFLISGLALPLRARRGCSSSAWWSSSLGAVVGKVMPMMGMGSTVTYKDERDPEYDDHDRTARATSAGNCPRDATPASQPARARTASRASRPDARRAARPARLGRPAAAGG